MRPDRLVPILLVTLSWGAAARPLHYDAVQEPAVVACDKQSWRGQREEAMACYRQLQQRSTDPAVQAEAAWALGDPREANRWFQEAARQRPEDPDVRVRWGDLYTDTYQNEEALKLYREALNLDPKHSYAGVGAARVLAEGFLTESWQYLRPVLEDEHSHGHTVADEAHAGGHSHRGARIQGFLLQAWMALESGDRKETLHVLDSVTTLAEGSDLPQLEIYALRAALDLLDGAEDSPWIGKALAENPGYGDIYATPAHFFWINHRYRESVALYEKALAIDPENRKAEVELGINLLRDNRLTEARRHLEAAYEADPFNPKSVNTLRLLDTLEGFATVTVPEKPEPGGFPRLAFRLDKKESPALRAYAGELTSRGIEQFAKRYRLQPKETIVIEIYPNHEDFVVRTVGMPGLGILGATFGYLFAMDSPTAHPEPDYHWGTTLWHELAHVFTLEASRHTVPRWFSEGVSVYEEWRHGPIPGIRIPIETFQAMAEDKLLPIEELDGGFIRPSYDSQVQVSYTQAGLVCEFIAREFGEEKLVDLLYAFDYKVATPEAIEKTFGMNTGEFDRHFGDFLDREYRNALVFKLDLWKKALAMAGEAFEKSDWETASEYARKAIEIHPDYAEGDSPYLLLARAESEQDDAQAQYEALQTYFRKGGYAPEALAQLAEMAHARGEKAEAIRVMQSLNYARPFDEQLHSRLGDWLLEQDRPREALAEFEVLLALEPHDRAAALFKVASAWQALGNAAKTRQYLLRTLDIAPHFRPAQKLLLELTQPKTE
jgi:tetratricopeptide (TPR) repeat protein